MSGADDLDDLEQAFLDQYETQDAMLERLYEAETSAGEKEKINQLDRIKESGLQPSLSRLGDDSRTKRLTLVTEFVEFGAKAVLLTGSQRAGDFLNNQLRGQWAERAAVSMDVPGLVLVPFGPSAAAMPGEEDHRHTI